MAMEKDDYQFLCDKRDDLLAEREELIDELGENVKEQEWTDVIETTAALADLDGELRGLQHAIKRLEGEGDDQGEDDD